MSIHKRKPKYISAVRHTEPVCRVQTKGNSSELDRVICEKAKQNADVLVKSMQYAQNYIVR